MFFKKRLLLLLSKLSSAFHDTSLGSSKWVALIQRWLFSIFFRKDRVRIDDFVFFIHKNGDYISRKLLLFGGYEKNEIFNVCSLIQKGETVVDIGANIGLYSVFLSRSVGSTGEVLAFEPDPENLVLLQKNIEINKCKNIKVFPFALGDRNSVQRLYLCEGNKGCQSFADLGKSGKFIRIKVKNAEEALSGYCPSFIKMDVEGAEPMIWKTMKCKPKNMLFEFVPSQIRSAGNDPLLFLESLEKEGYYLRYFEGQKLIRTTPLALTQTAIRTGRDYNVMARLQVKN